MLRFQHQSQCWAFYKQHIVHRTLLNQTKSLRMQHSVWKWQFEAKQAFVCKRSISIYLFYFIWSALVQGKAQRKLHTKINMKLQVGEVGSCTSENFNTSSPQMQRASWLSWGTMHGHAFGMGGAQVALGVLTDLTDPTWRGCLWQRCSVLLWRSRISRRETACPTVPVAVWLHDAVSAVVGAFLRVSTVASCRSRALQAVN